MTAAPALSAALYLLALALAWVLLAWEASDRGHRWRMVIYLVGAGSCLALAYRFVQAAGLFGGA